MAYPYRIACYAAVLTVNRPIIGVRWPGALEPHVFVGFGADVMASLTKHSRNSLGHKLVFGS